MTSLIPSQNATAAPYSNVVREALRDSRTGATQRAYATAWAQFRAWCEDRGILPMPAHPAHLADWLAEAARDGLATSTLGKRRAAIKAAHLAAGKPDPTAAEVVRLTMRGLTNRYGRPQQGKSPVLNRELRAVLSGLDRSTLVGARDAAMILVGFAGGFRRSELVKVRVSDIVFREDGARILIPRSKTDQAGEGKHKHLPAIEDDLDVCPVRALRAWLDAAGIDSGPVFRKIDRWGKVGRAPLTGQVVALVVKQRSRDIGMDARQYAGHSLRSGLATSALMAGEKIEDVADQLGHANIGTTMKYKKDAGYGARRASRAALMGRE